MDRPASGVAARHRLTAGAAAAVCALAVLGTAAPGTSPAFAHQDGGAWTRSAAGLLDPALSGIDGLQRVVVRGVLGGADVVRGAAGAAGRAMIAPV